MTSFQKFTYWVSPDKVPEIRAEIEAAGHDYGTVRRAICIPFTPKWETGLVPAEVFGQYQVCKRQLQWYFNSPFQGLALLVSNVDLSELGLEAETIVSPAPDFNPPALAEPEDLPPLARLPEFLRAKPETWNRIGNHEFQNWQKIMGLKDVGAQELLLWHSANHANFINPRFFVPDGDRPTPYSIGPTSRTCSACLEFTNIIGREHPRKLVRPCPGAVLFARLTPNAYYEVVNGPAAGG